MNGVTVDTYTCDNDSSDENPMLMPIRVQPDYGSDSAVKVYRLIQEEETHYITLNGARQVLAAIEALEKQ